MRVHRFSGEAIYHRDRVRPARNILLRVEAAGFSYGTVSFDNENPKRYIVGRSFRRAAHDVLKAHPRHQSCPLLPH